LIALDAALDQLTVAEPRLAKLVELRFFGGMTLDEAGAVVGLSPTTLKRDWSKARAFLHASISSDPA
jgi:DNA-directed RNA polymerase specialized sigma24 family protein